MIGVQGRSNFAAETKQAFNPTAAAYTQFGVYAVDIYRTNAASVDPDTAANNLVAVNSTNVLGARFAVAQTATPATSNGPFVHKGFTQCLVLGPVNPGDYLQAVSGQVYLAKIAAGAAFPTNVAYAAVGQFNDTAIGGATTAVSSVDFFGSPQQRSN